MRRLKLLFAAALVMGVVAASPYVGYAQRSGATLKGRVTDAETGEPLPAANVRLKDSQLATLSDEEGNYALKDIPPGVYAVQAEYLGYAPLVVYEVRLEAGTNELDLAMQLQADTTAEVTIQAETFKRTITNLVSTKKVGIEQIRSNPGGNQDISRVVQSLPGVSGSVSFRNDLIIRGGGPSENVYYLDGIEIPTLNHFATQGAAGGPVGILNPNLIQSFDLQATGFDAQYDNVLSGVLAFDMIDGNPDRFQTTVQVSATDAGITFEAPLAKNVTSVWSVRRSYLQLLFQAIGLPFLPDYWDYSGKIKWQIDPKTDLTFLTIGAVDRFNFLSPQEVLEADTGNLYILDGVPDIDQDSYTTGLSLRRITPKGYYTIALSRNYLNNRNAIARRDSLLEPIPDAFSLNFRSKEAEHKLRVNVVNTLGPWRLTYGGTVQQALYDADLFQLLPDQETGQLADTVDFQTSLSLWRAGAHASLARRFFSDRLRLNLGLRVDANSFTNQGWELWRNLQPRLAAAYEVVPKLTLTASVGLYNRLPAYTILGYQENGAYVNQGVDYIRSLHYVAGAEYQLTPSWVVAAEGFYKDYYNYPVATRTGLSLANQGGDFGVIGNEPVSANGRGRTYGLEVYTQKLLTERFYGIATYTLFWSQYTGLDGTAYTRSSWDNRHLISLTGGVRLGKDKTWEIAAKWRFLGGFPYTPWDTSASLESYPVTGQGIPDSSRINAQDTRFFSQIDLRVDKRFFFKKWSLQVFIDIQNVLNTVLPVPPEFSLRRDPANPTTFLRDENGNYIPNFIEDDDGSLIPSIGVRVKF